MAAYAALVSLMNTMDQIHPRVSTFFNKNQLESLGGTVVFLLDFIESYNYGGVSKQMEDLEAEIACAAHAAEDVIESHIVDLILADSTKIHLEGEIASVAHVAEDVIESHMVDQILAETVSTAICNLQKVTKDMDSIKEIIGKVEMQGRFKNQTQQAVAVSSRPVSAGKTASMVGFDDYLYHLLDKLTGLPSHQQVIPIIGMGGIGKTTLARNAFESPLIKHHFDVRAWATISQNYSAEEVLIQLLSSQVDRESLTALNERQLGEKLHKSLFSRRYLVVLDDMWSIDVWDEIKFFFPDNNNGGRIVLTSRLHDISLNFKSPYLLTINLLDEDKSWNLFCQESFGEETCTAELEEVGKKICENCKGLPLSIVVIGGFLRKSSKARVYWEGVAKDTYSVLNSEGGNECMSVLSLSYNHLPAHLKPCFLYLGVFAEDESIPVSRLIKLWVAEGFLRPNDGQSLEEVAEGYLKDLVDRNLILVNQWGSTGKMRACKIHDLIRELCLLVAEKEKFLCVMALYCGPTTINRERHIVIRNGIFFDNLGSAPLVRSLKFEGSIKFNFRLLRVLSVVERTWDIGFLEAYLRCVNLRHLESLFVFDFYDPMQSFPTFRIPRKISLLWNLQTMRINGYRGQIIAPSEIWEMVQLRHLQVDILYVPDPLPNDREDLALPNLQTLCKAMNFRLSEEVCKRIPSVKKLHLVYSELPQRCGATSYYCPQNLIRFHKLESLTLRFLGSNWRHMVLSMTFPTSLKKLTLSGGNLDWKDLEMIGSLPNLELLKLNTLTMKGSEWSPVEGQFRCLKFLQINWCTLTEWNADHFPVLEKLVLECMWGLVEIPSGIGEIPTLRLIRLSHCKAPFALSAVKILEEQENSGNEDLQVEVEFRNDEEHDRCIEMMEEEGFTSKNLHIKRIYK